VRRNDVLDWAAVAAVALAGFAFAYRSELEGRRRPAPPPRQALQLARAVESGRGRRAASPFDIPWVGWKDILLRTYHQIQDDRLMALAAGVVFYSLLALFPAITAGVSVYGLFADAHSIGQNLSVVSDIVPTGGLDIVSDQIARIVTKGGGALTLGFLFGLALALWSANAGVKSILDALNVIYDESEKRGIIRLNALSLLFTLCGILISL
jgi:membrane protein